MTLQEYVDEVKLHLTGGILNLELPDETIAQVVKKSLRELQRYIDETKLVTVPFSKCIDLGPYTDKDGVEHPGFNSSAIVSVYRTQGYTGDQNTGITESDVDPMYAQMWMSFSNGGTMYNLNDYVMNYLSYNTLLQMRNTTSTDLSFKEDKLGHKLYINTAFDNPVSITIEYIPKFENVEEIVDDYWKDILVRLSLAQTKVLLGRIRTRFKQSSALYTDDGDTILAEGQEELKELRTMLDENSQLNYAID